MQTDFLSNLAGRRMQMDESIQRTIDSLSIYGPAHDHWAIAWSGGKDSTATLTVLLWLLLSRKIDPPKSLTVLYADTRLELLPLWLSAEEVREEIAVASDELLEAGVLSQPIRIETVMAPMDKRFLVYMLGRGVPPPNNNTLRWCTRQIKIDPMKEHLEEVFADNPEPVLMLTGVRQGESAVRDNRISLSCSKDGSECGQGWYQTALPKSRCATLAPLLHWRVCHVWEWLRTWAPLPEYGDWSTELLAEAYGGDEAEESHARTGCIGCPLATRDTALDGILAMERWAYLQPLKRLRPLWRELREPARRLRQPGGEARKDGTLAKNQQRLGPILLDERLRALDAVLSIQGEINAAALLLGRPTIDLLNDEEEARIRELIAVETWPRGWTGEEPTGAVLLPSYSESGLGLSIQNLLPGFGKEAA